MEYYFLNTDNSMMYSPGVNFLVILHKTLLGADKTFFGDKPKGRGGGKEVLTVWTLSFWNLHEYSWAAVEILGSFKE